MSAQKPKAMRVKLVRSAAGKLPAHRATVRGLGLRHTGDERVIEDTPSTRGMVNAVSHLVTIVEDGTQAPWLGGV